MLATQSPTTTTAAIAIAATTEQLINLWLHGKAENTSQAYRRDIYEFLTFLASFSGIQEVNLARKAINLNELQSYENSLILLGRAKNTVARKLAAVKSLMSFMSETGLARSNAGKMLKIKTDDKPVTERILPRSKVLEMIYKVTNKRDRVALQMLYRLGLRASELCNVTWENISIKDNGDGLVSVLGKGTKYRVLIIPKDLLQDLLSLKKEGSTALFPSRKGSESINRFTLTKIVSKAAAAIGLQNVSAHWLRHCHVSHSLDAGAPISVVQSSVGHSSIATTERYIHSNPKDCSSRYL